MKHIFNTIILVLFVNSICGQVATIEDKDGWTNVRAEPNGESKSILKLNVNEVFWYDMQSFKNNHNWIEVYIPKNKYSLGCSETDKIHGFIHISRLLPLTEMVQPKKGELFFEYELAEFDESNHKIQRLDERWISDIDGRSPWGTDGTIPKIEVNGINVKMGENKININEVFYQDIFECSNDFKVYKNEGSYFVQQEISDGAGFYEIVWVIGESGLKQRLVGTMD